MTHLQLSKRIPERETKCQEPKRAQGMLRRQGLFFFQAGYQAYTETSIAYFVKKYYILRMVFLKLNEAKEGERQSRLEY